MLHNTRSPSKTLADENGNEPYSPAASTRDKNLRRRDSTRCVDDLTAESRCRVAEIQFEAHSMRSEYT